MTSQGMVLRNMSLVGATERATLTAEQRPVFEHGVRLLFGRWTALQLAVANEWGGSSSKQKAEELYEDVVGWFYAKKNHEMLDLEELLDEALQVEFNVQAEDDSPYQISRNLVNMHNQVARGDLSYVQALEVNPNPIVDAIRASTGLPGDNVEGGEGNESSSSEDESGDEDDEGGMDVDGMDEEAPVAVPAQPQEPLVDEDGFQRAVGRRGRRGNRQA